MLSIPALRELEDLHLCSPKSSPAGGDLARQCTAALEKLGAGRCGEREEAANRLANMGAIAVPHAAAIALALAEDGEWRVRLACARALGSLGSVSGVAGSHGAAALVAALADGSDEV
ncbi:unnamed protein product, partial [Prorocentrum cordatum]